MYHWVKGELFDIESVLSALSTKDTIGSKIKKNEKKKKNNEDNIENINAGRKTIKTIFKNKDDTGKMSTNIETVSILNHIFHLTYVDNCLKFFRLIKRLKL